jgi:ribonucleotide reductase beta subunit family protein with ferritin-like domain
VEDDLQELLTVLTESEKHAVTYILKLFTKYELVAGNEYWGGRVAKRFPRVCIQRMANSFAYAELNMHAPFYNEVNRVLNLDTEEFYTDYVNDPALKARMDHIGELISSKDDLLSLATFSIVEGAILYSAFAFLKHYRTGGKNLLKNLVSGINASVRDENLHQQGGAWLYGVLKKESGLSEEELAVKENLIIEAAQKIYEHECVIIDRIFEKGAIDGITPTQMKHFVESRVNTCLSDLGIKPIFEVSYNPIAEWFFDGINTIKLHDFFNTSGSEYTRNWSQERFIWQ